MSLRPPAQCFPHSEDLYPTLCLPARAGTLVSWLYQGSWPLKTAWGLEKTWSMSSSAGGGRGSWVVRTLWSPWFKSRVEREEMVGTGGNGTQCSLIVLPLFAVYWKDL